MAVLEEGLFSYLSTYAGLTALISARVYPFRIPQEQAVSLPCMTYQRISTPRHQTHDTSGASDLASPRFQFDAWAETYASAKAITDQIRAALNGKNGTIGSGGSAVTIQAALVQEETPELDPETNIYRSRSDFIIWHVE